MTRKGGRLFALWCTGLATVLFLALTVDSHDQFGGLTNAHNITPEVTRGKDVWHRYNCVNCHTLFGEGAYYAPDLTKITPRRGEPYLKAYMRDPSQFYDEKRHRRLMPKQNLSDAEISDLIKFLDWVSKLGDAAWAPATLARHAGLLGTIRRRFELLRARRVRLRKQLDGEEIDLEACVGAAADFRAGLPRSERLYQTLRPARREMAIALLVDASGSTDSWVSGNRRVIDVEREALLLVCIALETMRERYTVQAFSGEGPTAVTVRALKGFDEHHREEVSRRIAALEPERYTRVGAALRHVTAMLMREPARHRLLLLLSDGKPNDVDHYEGRYGVEDMRQAVTEAKLQGIFPFCLTVDRTAAAYLPGVFGANQYALLPRPELLPTVLLDWIRRLAST